MKIYSEQSKTEISYSENLGSWLHEQNITLAMTCYQTGQLVFLGSDRFGQVVFNETNYKHVMGLAKDKDTLLISTFDAIVRFSGQEDSTTDLQSKNKGIIYTPSKINHTGDIDVHEMGIDKEGNVVFVNTCYSCISKLSDDQPFEPIWKPPFISSLKAEHRCHLNGMCLIDGEIRYASAISNADVPDGWRGKRSKTGVLVDVESGETVIEKISMPHSPRMHDGSLWLLESGRGYLQKVHTETFERDDVAFCPGFLRGLSFHGQYAIAGMSLGRDDGFVGLDLDEPLKRNNIIPQCGIQIIDITTGQTKAWLRFEGKIRELFSIEVLPGIGRAKALTLEANQFTPKFSINPNLDII